MSETEYIEVTLDAVSVENNGLMWEGKWTTVEGNATEYLSQYKKDDNVRLGINNNKVVFIKALNDSKPKSEEKKDKEVISPFDYKQDLILAQSTLKNAIEIACAKYGNEINTTLVKTIHKDLFKYMKEEGYK